MDITLLQLLSDVFMGKQCVLIGIYYYFFCLLARSFTYSTSGVDGAAGDNGDNGLPGGAGGGAGKACVFIILTEYTVIAAFLFVDCDHCQMPL